MWETLVVLVRLPVTLVWLAFATAVGLPFIVISRMALFVLGYAVTPVVLLWHAFHNEREEFTKHLDETDKLRSQIPESVEGMYKEILRWGFPK